jgi:hypothetical protein
MPRCHSLGSSVLLRVVALENAIEGAGRGHGIEALLPQDLLDRRPMSLSRLRQGVPPLNDGLFDVLWRLGRLGSGDVDGAAAPIRDRPPGSDFSTCRANFSSPSSADKCRRWGRPQGSAPRPVGGAVQPLVLSESPFGVDFDSLDQAFVLDVMAPYSLEAVSTLDAVAFAAANRLRIESPLRVIG